MNGVIINQIVGTLMFFIMFAMCTFAAVMTKDIPWIIASIVLGILSVLFLLNSIKVIKQEKGIKLEKDVNYGVWIGFIIILTLFGTCSCLLVRNIYFRATGEKTTAIVYDVNKTVTYETEYDDEGNSYEKEDEHCDVFVEYEVNNKNYKSKLEAGNCKLSEGDKVTIYYNKDNPNDFVSGNLWILTFASVFTGFGFILYIVQWIKGVKGTKKKNKKKQSKKKK